MIVCRLHLVLICIQTGNPKKGIENTKIHRKKRAFCVVVDCCFYFRHFDARNWDFQNWWKMRCHGYGGEEGGAALATLVTPVEYESFWQKQEGAIWAIWRSICCCCCGDHSRRRVFRHSKEIRHKEQGRRGKAGFKVRIAEKEEVKKIFSAGKREREKKRKNEANQVDRGLQRNYFHKTHQRFSKILQEIHSEFEWDCSVPFWNLGQNLVEKLVDIVGYFRLIWNASEMWWFFEDSRDSFGGC